MSGNDVGMKRQRGERKKEKMRGKQRKMDRNWGREEGEREDRVEVEEEPSQTRRFTPLNKGQQELLQCNPAQVPTLSTGFLD